MAGERVCPILTVPHLDEAIAFYTALGFRRTYRQLRPNPYAVVELEDIGIHLSAVEGFDPTTSLGSVIVVVPDAEALHTTLATGLRQAYGRLPTAGIPRLLRPRRKAGTTAGSSVIDVGGNWLRSTGPVTRRTTAPAMSALRTASPGPWRWGELTDAGQLHRPFLAAFVGVGTVDRTVHGVHIHRAGLAADPAGHGLVDLRCCTPSSTGCRGSTRHRVPPWQGPSGWPTTRSPTAGS